MTDALIAIDLQIDFCDVQGAALPVTGAVKDVERLADFIKKKNPSAIFSSLDTHYTLDISHPKWWIDSAGKTINPFTMIFAEDIENGKYTPVIDPKRSLAYVKHLEANGEFNHFIWPEHCIKGTVGQTLHPTYFKAIEDWMVHNKGKWVAFIDKGVNPYTEHFGIFRANVPIPEDSSTDINQGVIKALNSYDRIWLAGEAQTHCVANSLRQLLQIAPQLGPKIVVLEDCMSPVPGLPQGFYDMVQGLYDDAKAQGVTFESSTNIV